MMAAAEMYISGVSTRQVEKVMQEFGIETCLRPLSRATKQLDKELEAWRNRPIEVVMCTPGSRFPKACCQPDGGTPHAAASRFELWHEEDDAVPDFRSSQGRSTLANRSLQSSEPPALLASTELLGPRSLLGH